MLKQNEPFKTSGARRRILVVDDELINREMLSICLQDSYEILQAGDGAQAMEILRSRGEEISLVLLDILMPVMSGMEVLAEMRGDPVLSRIPVIVLTADSDAEVECLKMGAADFIPKPYPAPAVVQARVLRTIELSEDRETIQSTERDQLTGLYNREFFFRYAKQLDQLHRGEEMDAVLIDVDHFHLINERYGRVYGDEVLRRIGENARAVFSPARTVRITRRCSSRFRRRSRGRRRRTTASGSAWASIPVSTRHLTRSAALTAPSGRRIWCRAASPAPLPTMTMN